MDLLPGEAPVTPYLTGRYGRTDWDELHYDVAATRAWLSRADPPALALDIETRGLMADALYVKAVSISDGHTAAVLDPRVPEQAALVREITSRTRTLWIHNASYDIPPLVVRGLMRVEDIPRVHDTLIDARLGDPDPTRPKSLDGLAQRILGWVSLPDAELIGPSGAAKQADFFRDADTDYLSWTRGAATDAVVTARIAPVVHEWARSALAAVEHGQYAAWATDPAEMIARQQTVGHMMARASADGLLIDRDYHAAWQVDHEQQDAQLRVELGGVGIRPGVTADLMAWLDGQGLVPARWPRTAGGALSGTADTLEDKLSHVPMVGTFLAQKRGEKIAGYLAKCADAAEVTGRLYPQATVLGASATGRTSYSAPPLQQFSGSARGVLVPDTAAGWCSIDWSSIEPITLALIAGESALIGPYRAGEDLYGPVMATAGVTRSVAKVVLLAAMYGQGQGSLASRLSMARGESVGTAEARAISDRVMGAMPRVRHVLDTVRDRGRTTRHVVTLDGRPLPCPVTAAGQVLSYKVQNYLVQGSAYGILAATIEAGARAGLAGTLRLSLHDELVVDADSADEWQEIMSTPPDFMRRLGAVTDGLRLRTDRAPLPDSWAKV